MPSEQELRELFSSAQAPGALDANRVIARAKARRRPRRLAVGAVGVLAIAGVALAGFQLSRVTLISSAVLEAPVSDSGAESSTLESGVARAQSGNLNLCGETRTEIAPSASGLQLDLTFPESVPVGTSRVDGTVRMTNLGSTTVAGTAAASPAITISQDGIVLWHSNGSTVTSVVVVDLAPGESVEYPASFSPVRCDPEDDLSGNFRADLPPLSAGDYQLSAMLDVSWGMDAVPELVTGPPATVRLQ